jgi:hypothetical protein
MFHMPRHHSALSHVKMVMARSQSSTTIIYALVGRSAHAELRQGMDCRAPSQSSERRVLQRVICWLLGRGSRRVAYLGRLVVAEGGGQNGDGATGGRAW